MNDTTTTTTTEKKQYTNAPLADKEYYAKPRWHEVAVSAKSGNLILTVLWDVCDKDGHPGNFDPDTGAKIPLPPGADSWEAISQTYVIAYADEAKTLAKCKGKDLEYLKDVCPRTYTAMKRIISWCPGWDARHVMWFSDCKESFYSTIVRVTCVHEEWNGQPRAKAKWTNPKERAAKEVDTTETRQKITSTFGGFFDVKESAPAPQRKEPPAPSASTPPAPQAQAQAATKADCWATYCRHFVDGAKNTDTWFRLIAAVGKPESDFSAADWAKLQKDILAEPNF